MKHYKLTTYANGFGTWHCQINFEIGLGNTPEAEKIISNSLISAKRSIRRELLERNNNLKKRLGYFIKATKFDSMNRIWSITICEK